MRTEEEAKRFASEVEQRVESMNRSIASIAPELCAT
jgi:hypothetical protein